MEVFKKFYENCQMDERIKKIPDKKVYQCAKCNRYKSKDALCVIDHYVAHHEERKFQCPLEGCERELDQIHYVAYHMRHSEEHKKKGELQCKNGESFPRDDLGFLTVMKNLRKSMGMI